MTGRGDGTSQAAGGPALHTPVLLAEVLTALRADGGGVYLDGTFGAGGYANAILAANPANRVIAVDRDPNAIAAGQALVAAHGGRLGLVEGRFGDLDELAAGSGWGAGLDGIVLDIGVSSMQLDQAERGFSFRHDGPLDMRMEAQGESAADLVNEAEEALLADIIYHYGEERRARAVARAIVERRRRARFETTRDLADLVASLVRADPHGPHPATRTFQALRIAVNDELGELSRALHAAERVLKPGGRLVVVTFHSLEDRIVKQFLATRAGRAPGASRHAPVAGPALDPTFRLATKGPVAPGKAELFANPRARSAKLRAGERTSAPAQPPVSAVETLAALPRTAKERGRR
ncbi:MAG: 16S rRNA (cytosine(1402)-N(4))-methyltransferase RsmH [Salinarimonadaceae bacterium]|nr:MAG: 16S rRNA (cytosine(1402)-N(4))-methyltransferase RsmH [Salinarimonadaceae bacterium]